ncbi:hypothetical protein ANCCAN_27795, partial [Ancylostoma caninum]
MAKKIQEYNRAVARHAEEKELRERRERVRRAQEANRKAQEEAAKFAADGDFGGMPGGDPTGGLGAVLNDPEVAEAIKDPEVMAAFLDIMNNPANLMKHMGNPKVMKLIAKMKGRSFFNLVHCFRTKFLRLPQAFPKLISKY